MKVSLECEVKGKIIIGQEISFNKGILEYYFKPDEKGWLKSIKVVKKVSNPEKYSASFGPSNGKAAATINIGGDREEYLGLIWEFQELESVLSFATKGSLKSIEWDSPEENFIPETEEEKKRVQVQSFSFKKEYPDYPVSLNKQELNSIIQSKDNYHTLIVPKAFYREGINEFTSRRYINAFYNFYFVLEDIYGKGKTKNKDIIASFRNSKDFREITEGVLQRSLARDEKHRTNIQRFCKEENVTYDVDGIINLLQKVRGNLHHYSSRSTKRVGTPFTHEDFEGIAFLVLGLAIHTILRCIVQINKAEKKEK